MAGAQERLYPRFKLWISSSEAEGVFGDGKCRLLAAIEREGSLRAASESLGVSYRKAWGDLRKAERSLGVTFLDRRRGGSGGGQTTGRRWLAAYMRFRREIRHAIAKAYDTHMGMLLERAKGEG